MWNIAPNREHILVRNNSLPRQGREVSRAIFGRRAHGRRFSNSFSVHGIIKCGSAVRSVAAYSANRCSCNCSCSRECCEEAAMNARGEEGLGGHRATPEQLWGKQSLTYMRLIYYLQNWLFFFSLRPILYRYMHKILYISLKKCSLQLLNKKVFALINIL